MVLFARARARLASDAQYFTVHVAFYKGSEQGFDFCLRKISDDRNAVSLVRTLDTVYNACLVRVCYL